MISEKVDSETAIGNVKRCVDNGQHVLGVDGFQIVESGHIARLDLILDLTINPVERIDSARIAEKFIRNNSAPDILFEIVCGDLKS